MTDAEALADWLREAARRIADERDALTALDAAIGDADHGSNLDRGMSAVVAALDTTGGPAGMLRNAGMTLVSTVGGASGPLYGTLLLRMAGAIGAGQTADDGQLAAALRAGVDGVAARGRSAPGEKTMLDALVPACDALDAALADGASLADALAKAAAAAAAGRDATVPMLARKGRASYLGERSIGHADPGATSSALLIAAAAATLGQARV